MDGPERSDEELARLTETDEAAVADLYHRYFSRVYDYALRVARDREIAALVVQSSLLRALGAAPAGQVQDSFRLQLFAGAHYDLADRLRPRRESGVEPDVSFSLADPALAGSPSLAGELPELGRAAWQACAALRLDEYELLDLNVRQRLDVAEIAAIARTRPEAVERRLASAEAELEASFATLLLAARGRQACLDLDFLVGDEAWSPSLRRRVARHLQTCLTCQRTRQRYSGAVAILAAFALVPAPDSWQKTILMRLQEALRTGSVPEPVPVRAVALPSPARRAPAARRREAVAAPAGGGLGDVASGIIAGAGSRGPLLLVLGGAVLVAAITVGALCAGGVFDDGGPAAGATPTESPTPGATRTPTASPTVTPTITSTFAPLVPTSTPLPTLAPTATEPPPTRLPSATPILVPVPTATPLPPTP